MAFEGIERHQGPPMTVLDDVRRSHNVVGAFPDIEAARAAIVALEQSGVIPEAISLLGAWPRQDHHQAPVGMYRRISGSALAGAVVLGLIGLLALGSWVWAMTGVIVGATSGGLIGWVAGMGLSHAWEDTFAADDSGTFAVGVHSDHPDEAAHGESVLLDQGSLAVNRFS